MQSYHRHTSRGLFWLAKMVLLHGLFIILCMPSENCWRHIYAKIANSIRIGTNCDAFACGMQVWLRESRTRILAYITIIAFSSGEWLISGTLYETNFYCLGTENNVKPIYYSLCCWLLTIYLEAEGSIICAVFSDACMVLSMYVDSFFSLLRRHYSFLFFSGEWFVLFWRVG